MNSIESKSLKLHHKHKGKLEIKSKMRLDNAADLALAYTPGVAEICRQIVKNKKNVYRYTIKNNSVAIVTDGSAVLGLGNIGPLAALPVMEGKAILHKKFAGLDAFPICLDTQDPEQIIATIKFIAPVFGAIQLEDIASPKCFFIERRLKKKLSIPVVHDDQHATAVVVLAALINSLKYRNQVQGLPKSAFKEGLKKTKIVINGAGAAGVGISNLLLAYGFNNLIVLDSAGIIFSGRRNLSVEKKLLAKQTNRQKTTGDLSKALVEADVFVGVSKAGLLKPLMIKHMRKNPIIFALANPVPEIMPTLATNSGALIMATGRSDFPNQINNVLAFPGIFRGALDNGQKNITSGMLMNAAKNLAALVKKPGYQNILPSVFDKRAVNAIARAMK